MKPRYFDLAKKIASKSPSKYKLGCVIVKKSRVIAVGYNDMNKTNPNCKTTHNYLHAEIHALIGTDASLTRNATAYVYREDRNGKISKSRPCPVCLSALRIAQIRSICYTDTIQGFVEEKI